MVLQKQLQSKKKQEVAEKGRDKEKEEQHCLKCKTHGARQSREIQMNFELIGREVVDPSAGGWK